MCGIFGFTGEPDHELLKAMGDVVRHRGPDDSGYWSGAPLPVSLGMRRLSIVDLETGQQPVSNEDGTVHVVFNGEIYNHVELRSELEAKGHVFKTRHSDTEVLVHLYEEEGPAFLSRLIGMFAIALWDGRDRSLHLARDHSGIKPLYFSRIGRELVFGSEIKSILKHPKVRKAPDFRSIHHYFSLKNVPAPWSAFDGIEQLRPGERLELRDGKLKRERWWRIRFREDTQMDEREAAASVRALLEDSVRLQMRSDVDVGAYLSGGVDSSSVVALMARLSPRPVKTFTLAYEDSFRNKESDRAFAKLMSERLGTVHHEYVLRADEVADTAESVIQAFDEPFSGVTSTFFLTRLISKHVKVALSGDGADELFGSYLPHRLAEPLAGLRARKAGDPGAGGPPELEALLARGDEAASRMAQYLADEPAKRSLYSARMIEEAGPASTEAWLRALYAEAGTPDPLNRALFIDFETLLPDQVLAFVDRLSMAHSVEVRPPFLDHRLIELASRIPGKLKIRGGRVKHVLKEAVSDLLPPELLDRPKEGFVLPVNDWLLERLRPYALHVLTPERIAKHGLLRSDAVQALIDAHYSRQANHGPRIWNLIAFQVWWEKYFA